MNVDFDLPKMTPPREGESPWVLAEEWTIRVDDAQYTIPCGFQTDGASIPRFLWRICGTPMQAPRLYAALLHDAAYDGVIVMTRKEADKLFRDIQISLGVSKVKAYTEYYALRLFGGSHWQDGKVG